jgi:adenosine kinase
MQKVAITGSVAYDHLMSFDGKFSDVILPEQLSNLSVSFYAQGHEVFFGGCAPNIAFTLKMLGGEPAILGVAGNDFAHYDEWLKEHGIDTDGIFVDELNPTASANILSDNSGSQITSFSPGAMASYDGELSLKNESEICYGIVAPQMPSRMLDMARYFSELGVEFIFDPGQAMSSLKTEDCELLLEQSSGLIVNEYEAEMMSEKVGLSMEEISKDLGFAIKTTGENGCELIILGESTILPALKDLEVEDPTGCGDAFRAGLLYSLMQGESLSEACLKGNVAASFVVEKEGTQKHQFSMEEFNNRLSLLSTE